MSDPVICPTCRTRIDPGERCESERGMGRCMESQGHDGWHWSDMGSGDGSVLIWTGLYQKRSCPERLTLNRWCQKPPGHEGTHNDGRGVSWVPEDAEDREAVPR